MGLFDRIKRRLLGNQKRQKLKNMMPAWKSLGPHFLNG